MRFRNLDENNDWTFGKGKQSYLTNSKALFLNLKTRINSFLNDCFFAIDEGIDWFNLLGKDRDALLAAIRKTIIETPGVIRINTLDIFTNSITRKISLIYNIDTQYTNNQNAIQEVLI